VVVIPAGVGHKRLSEKRDGFTVVGGYPPGQSGAITRPGELSLKRPKAPSRHCIAGRRPVLGETGPLISSWAIR
jgi:uncharacterized protein YjlB